MLPITLFCILMGEFIPVKKWENLNVWEGIFLYHVGKDSGWGRTECEVKGAEPWGPVSQLVAGSHAPFDLDLCSHR